MEDEVDRIAAAWQRERPELDVAPMQVLSRVTRLARRLETVRKDAFAAHGLQAWEFDVLAALRRAGEPHALSPGQLSTGTLVTSGTMTNRVDRLIERGFVTREPAFDDRRSVLVRLTEEGRSAVDGAFAELLTRETELLAPINATTRRDVAATLRQLLEPFS